MGLRDHNYETIQFPTKNRAYIEWITTIEEECRWVYGKIVIDAYCTECYPYDMPGAGIIRCENQNIYICNYCGAKYYVAHNEKLAELLRKI